VNPKIEPADYSFSKHHQIVQIICKDDNKMRAGNSRVQLIGLTDGYCDNERHSQKQNLRCWQKSCRSLNSRLVFLPTELAAGDTAEKGTQPFWIGGFFSRVHSSNHCTMVIK